MKLTAEFTVKYSDTKDSGDVAEVRRLQKDLEAARDMLLEYLSVFIVPDAKNLYHGALIGAGLDSAKTQEQQEMTVDIRKEIQGQLAVYGEAKNDAGDLCLQEWVKDITDNRDLIYRAIAKDRAKITERIKEGMVPVVMPGKSVQIKTWKVALASLKPIWVVDGTRETVDEGLLYDLYNTEITNKMTDEGFFKNIPERPYLVWVKPTLKPDPDTMGKSFEDQQIFLRTLLEKSPNLYDPTDIIPTEYSALQAIRGISFQRMFKERTNGTQESKHIYPLDLETHTCFLSTGRFLYDDVPSAGFDHDNRQMAFGSVLPEANRWNGFRPVSRT